MKVVIEKSKFVDSVKKLNEITIKGTLPIVNCITFEVSNHDVMMGAYNIAQARYITIRKVTEVDREYKFAINSDKLYKLLSVIKSQFVSIEYNDDDEKLTLDIGTKIKFDNVLTNAEDYIKPDYVANPVKCQLMFMSNNLSTAINKVEWAYSRNKDEHRSALKGVCFDVCTNNNMLPQLPDGFSFNFNADSLQRILASFDGDVKWGINKSMTPIKFSVDEQYYVIGMPCR